MSLFITRVELHGAKHGDRIYELLHDEMEDENFSRVITPSDSTTKYHLPEAEYFKQGDYTEEQVRTSAKRAANKVVAGSLITYSVMVTGPNGIYWYNLKPVVDD